jgi:hypothetical protein
MAKEEVVEQGEQLTSARANTEANVWIQLIGAFVMTVVVTVGLHFGAKVYNEGILKFINGLINHRGPVQWLEVYSFFVVVFFMALKSRIVTFQIRHIYEDTAEAQSVNMDNEEELQLLRKRMHADGSDSTSIMLGRLDRGLGLWLSTKDVDRVSSWISAESSRDTLTSDMTFTMARTMMWVIPILGFIGTVQGLSAAVGGFAEFLSGAAELAAIKGAIANVTIGLGVAFDTTFLALVLVTLLQFPLTSIMRREAALLAEVDIYLDEHFVSRLPSAEQQPVVIENLEDSIEAAFRRYIPDPDRYEEVFTESIQKAGTVVEKQFEELTEQYVAARKSATDDEVRSLAAALESAHIKAAELAKEYAHSADEIQAGLQDSLQKATAAAEGVGKQIASIAEVGGQIQELLQVEQALERAVAGIAGADEFQKTFSQLREHLATTDEFCRRLSKPRIITLQEEICS